MLNVESTAYTTLNPKTLFIIFLTVVSFVLIDVVVGSLVDEYKDFTTSPAGISLFLAVTCVLFAGTYVILKVAENKMRWQNIRIYEKRIGKWVWTIYYIMIAIMAFVILQLLFSSEYYTALLSIAPTISYALAVFVLSLLAYRFLSWFVRNRALIVLIYGIASISASIYVVLTAVIFNEQILIRQPVVTTLESAGSFPELQAGVEEFLIIRLSQILTATTFLSFWGGTIPILYANIRRIGKKSFWIWILVATPILFFLVTLIFNFPVFQGVLPEDETSSFIFSFYITTFSQVAAIALFAAAFAIMARAIRHHQVSDYMYITCYGFALFSIAMIATVSGAGYPPFGLPSVSLVGPFSFLLFIGLNHSAIATAEDSNLRRSILVNARQQLRFLDSIGTAEWERELEKKVLEVTKSTADNLKEQSGIEPSISIDEAKQYIFEALEEIKNRRK
jgi:uncharacterized membrane protein YhaH (DUF805 family)